MIDPATTPAAVERSARNAKLGILAGGGPLPRKLARTCLESGRDVFMIAFTGHTDMATPEGVPHVWVRLGAVGKAIDRLRREGVSDLCMIGPVRRPSLRELMPDARGTRLAARVGLNARGDDSVLQALNRALADEGFRVVGVHELLDDLLARPGLLSERAPDRQDHTDIARALDVARTIGALDVGQGAVVQQGVVLAVEAAEGTDAMLDRCAGLRRDGGGGVLVKVRKPQQDNRVDLPTIGVTTVERAAAAGLSGIAVEAGGALIHDSAAVAETANRLGLFVLCFEIAS